MISPWDNRILGEFIGAYKSFMTCMEEAFVSEDVITNQYNTMIDRMKRVLCHYVDVSMTCRKFYEAMLDFEKLSQDYNRVLPTMHKHLSVEEYAELATLYADLKLCFEQCCMPEADSYNKFSKNITEFMKQISVE